MERRAAGQGEFRAGWPVVVSALLGIGLGLSPLPFYSIGIFAPHLARAFGWGFGQILGGLTITTIVVLGASPLTGLLADRFGVRIVALTSLGLFGLSFMAFAFTNGSLPLFYLNWAVMALLGAGTLPITWTRAVNNRFDVRKGFALGLSLLGSGVFGYLVKPAAAMIIASYGWRAAYLIIGALPLVIALPAGLFLFHDVDRPPTRADGQAAGARSPGAPGASFREALRDWRFWVIGIAFLPIAFALGGPIPNMENILRLAGFHPREVISLSSLIGLSVISGRIISGWVIDRLWAPGVAFVLLCAPAAACWLLAGVALSGPTAALAIMMIGFAAGMEFDLLAFLVARYFGMRSYGTIYGALYSFFALGSGLAPMVYGSAFDQTHSYARPLVQSAMLLVGGAAMLLTLGRYRSFQSPVAAVLLRAEGVADGSPV